MKPIIRVQNLGKQYRIGRAQAPYKTLRESISSMARVPFKFLSRNGKSDDSTIWALKDINFEVKPGEVVGIIGRNGAGKSTLLKILSRITEPTTGQVDLYGRVGSLLEVGTGFHPELTGRENVYLNGAILGMTRREMEGKFDEIVDFAEVARFIDTPVKRYSSGMYLRLAFAIAAHLRTEIVMVDEVLAVGDLGFQQKCLGKMDAVARDEGRTVLFVSHDITAIRTLCTTGCVLDGGNLEMRGLIEECVHHYLGKRSGEHEGASRSFTKPRGASPWMSSARLLVNGKPSESLRIGDRLTLEVHFASDSPISNPRLGFVISTTAGVRLLNANNTYQPANDLATRQRHGILRCELDIVPLMLGSYTISLWFGDVSDNTHVVMDALTFDVLPSDYWGTGKMPPKGASLLWWPTTFAVMSKEESR